MYLRIVFLLGFIAGMGSLVAQTAMDRRPLFTASSNKGNYLYLATKPDLEGGAAFAAVDHFVIKRVAIPDSFDGIHYDALQNKMKVIGEAHLPKTSKDLKEVLTENQITGLKTALKLKSDTALARYISSHPNPKSYVFLYNIIELRLALMHVYFDKTAKEGIPYFYAVYSVDKTNKELFWGNTATIGKAANYKLSYFKALADGVIVRDSSVTLQWKVPINKNYDSVPKPSKRFPYDKEGKLYNSFFNPYALRAYINLYADGKWERETSNTIFPRLNKTRDTLQFTFSRRLNPGSVVAASLVLEDDIHNEGGQSDTVNAFVLTENTAPRLRNLKMKDTINGFRLSWDAAPASSFLAGIQIIRFGVDKNNGDTLPLLPITDTTYMDYNVKLGINYLYSVRLLYLPGMAAYQTTPATDQMSLLKTSRPAPPFNLTAKNEGKNILLNWEVADNASIAHYFVYRGTNPEKLSVLPGMINEKTYLDTAYDLDGNTKYYYAVESQNINQDTSIYSKLVAVIPNRKLNIHPPTEMTFYYANNSLRVLWKDDSRQTDNRIVNYIVQKKLLNDSLFTFKTTMPTATTYLKDSGIEAGINYQYRVASISYRGDTSNFSPAFDYTLPKKRVDVLNSFSVFNEADHIVVSLPAIDYHNRKAYRIFKRREADSAFTSLTTIPATQYVYNDKNVKTGETYVYAIAVVADDGREGAIGMPMTLTR